MMRKMTRNAAIGPTMYPTSPESLQPTSEQVPRQQSLLLDSFCR